VGGWQGARVGHAEEEDEETDVFLLHRFCGYLDLETKSQRMGEF